MNFQKNQLRIALMAFMTFAFALNADAQQLRDETIKTNVTPIAQPLKVLQSLQPLSYEYRTQEYKYLKLPSGTHYGFMAEDFQQVLPGLVYTKAYTYPFGKNNTRQATVKSIDMESLIPVLIASIQEQQMQIEQLRAELNALKKQ